MPSDFVPLAEDLKPRFTYHPPDESQARKHEDIRGHALDFANMITRITPPSREQSLAITRLEEAIFWVNAAIARRGS